ncbi:MAG: nucleoside-diphosphate kinase [Patescibacteria group bacterium]|nr:nucleoside-diphosphate kinase [Patescibacteria group bacterium]MBU1160661.1 nucleoside-diphosphate kinase [Patescibacteria group bacterium]MBU1349705.1 nucleoside-diphosphate kinase [Patescibacteria group bacterium]MBU1421002.1 nucleoside-diphosphate kinase [Patescibacteria group bacterium]MBU1987226.1 nucleoside-diphosphate kinase [Patescibacteria group bacterium]
MHFKDEKTFVIIKPDGVQRSLIGEIIKRYERIGLKLVAIKMLIPSKQLAADHYYKIGGDEWLEGVGKKARAAYEKKGLKSPFKTNRENGEAVLERNAVYLSSGPVIVMIWQGNQAVALIRKLTGGTEPLTSDVGTIRGDLTLDSYIISDADNRSIRNLVHASGTVDEAEAEIKIWFNKNEILQYCHLNEKILYDINLDGIKE